MCDKLPRHAFFYVTCHRLGSLAQGCQVSLGHAPISELYFDRTAVALWPSLGTLMPQNMIYSSRGITGLALTSSDNEGDWGLWSARS